MDLAEARIAALDLMERYGLAGWSFSFDHAKRRFGSCSPHRKRITLSKTLTVLNSVEQVRETILHEIAHALTPGDGHGRRWKEKCVEMGVRPKACYRESEVVSPPRRAAPYLIGCQKCGWWADRYKMTRKRLVCRRCMTRVVIKEKGGGVLMGGRSEALPPREPKRLSFSESLFARFFSRSG